MRWRPIWMRMRWISARMKSMCGMASLKVTMSSQIERNKNDESMMLSAVFNSIPSAIGATPRQEAPARRSGLPFPRRGVCQHRLGTKTKWLSIGRKRKVSEVEANAVAAALRPGRQRVAWQPQKDLRVDMLPTRFRFRLNADSESPRASHTCQV